MAERASAQAVPGQSPAPSPEAHGHEAGWTGLEVAVVGMAGTFPGAETVDGFWRNLRGGVESVGRIPREELIAAGAAAAQVDHPDFVPVAGVLPGGDRFDAAFFGMTPREAEILNPQHRVFLEQAWTALEHAGYDPARFGRPVGVFAGSSLNTYIVNLMSDPALVDLVGWTRISLGNDKDSLATGTAYRLNLRGPGITVQTACSTSLVAVHLACQSLVNGECDLALAGGVSVHAPLRQGYRYVPGGINSPDGHCRPFDARAAGGVGGDGAGVVVLRRLVDALAAGDTVHAVIRGSAVNNDGSDKVGYTAPSVAGQARVIAEALAVAGVEPRTIHYVEAHGSGTPLGDAVEMRALNQVFGRHLGAGDHLGVGSVKPNVGHLDVAAGVTGLIKATLALKNREIPPSLNFETPSPQIDFAGGPLYVNTSLREWTRNGTPRRAGVSSFGLGGTNAHVVLEEAPPAPTTEPARGAQLLVLSARTETALSAAVRNLADALEGADAPDLADAAHTLRMGRREMEWRAALACTSPADAVRRLRGPAGRPTPRCVDEPERPVAFLLPGLGMQYPGMGQGVYEFEPVFRETVDRCCKTLLPHLGRDLREILYPTLFPPDGVSTAATGPIGANDSPASMDSVDSTESADSTELVDSTGSAGSLGSTASTEAVSTGSTDSAGSSDSAVAKGGGWDLRAMLGRGGEEKREPSPLDETRWAQPAVFVTEYALARLFASWGVAPAAMLGHSLGEYVCACLAGVLAEDDALALVALRARLIDGLPEGAMLAVTLPEDEAAALLAPDLAIAAVNTPGSCVVAGPVAAVEAFARELEARQVVNRRLPTRHAFHSPMMEPVAAGLGELLGRFRLGAPTVPFVSNVTGTWITDEEARSPAYWARHLCRTVRFADGLAALRRTPGAALLEVGAGQTLGAWAMQAGTGPREARAVFSALPHAHNRTDDHAFLLETLGGLWSAGAAVAWDQFRAHEPRRRVPLPTYPFERARYWVDARRSTPAPAASPAPAAPTAAAEGPAPMDNVLEAPAAPEAQGASPRHRAILAELTRLAARLTGFPEEEVPVDVHFLDGGIDSLGLLQASQAVEKTFGIRIPLLQLMEETNTLLLLAAFLEDALDPSVVVEGQEPAPPAAAEAPQPSPAAAAETSAPAPANRIESAMPVAEAPPPASVPAPAYVEARMVPAPPRIYPPAEPAAGAGGLERVIGQQLQLMAQQLAALQGHAPVAAEVASVPAAPTNGAVLHAAEGASAASANGASVASTNGSSAPSANGIAAVSTEGGAQPAHVARPVKTSARAKYEPETFVPFRPLSPEASGLTEQQRAYLADFTRAYHERTRASRAHQERYGHRLADGRVTAKFRRQWKELCYPVVGDRAQGSRIWDLDGNEYVDIGMGFGCTLFGHAPDFITRAIQDQVAKGYGIGPQSGLAARAADLLCEVSGNDRAVFCNSGTEAVMGAMRACRTVTQRDRVACFAGSYHGWSDGTLARLTGKAPNQQVVPAAPGIPAAHVQNLTMLNYDDPNALDVLAREVDQLAVVMIEPVQSRRLDIQPSDFIREVRRLTEEAGTLLMFDELVTGFRIRPGGAQEYFGVRADVLTYGKVVAGGLPMGVVSGKRKVLDAFDGGEWRFGDDSYPMVGRTMFAGAYFKHPLSMSVVCAVMEEIRREGLPMYERLAERTAALTGRINAFLDASGVPIEIVHFGSIMRFYYRHDVEKYADLFIHHLYHNGIYAIIETGTAFLCTAHTDADLEAVYQGIVRSVRQMQEGGFLPGAAVDAAADVARPKPADAGAPASAHAAAGAPAAPVSVPLTEGQKQLWVESQMSEDASRAYVESTSLHLHGPLDFAALGRALQALVDRHDTLRITFDRDGEHQLIHPSVRLDLPLTDLSRLAPAEREKRLARWRRREASRPFDLVAGPLVRCAVAALAPEHHVLAISNHHAIADGYSFSVMMGDLGELYAAAKEGREPALPAPKRFGDFAVARTADVPRREMEDAHRFWTECFADGVPVLELPTDRPRPPVRTYRGERFETVMDEALLERLSVPARKNGLTLFHLLLSAFYVWLGRLSGQDDLVVGVPSAGQAAAPDTAGLVGYNINVLPLRTRVDPGLSIVALAKQVRRTALQAIGNQFFSFPRLVGAVCTGDAGRRGLFSVMFNVDRGGDGSAFHLGDLRVDFEENFSGAAKVDLAVNVTEAGFSLYCDYNTDLFDAATIERWFGAFARLVESAAERPDDPVSSLDAVPDEELRAMVDDFNSADLAC